MSTAYERELTLTVEEISQLAFLQGHPGETLASIVSLIAERFETDVCSIYLLEPDRAHLVLAATVGLRGECVGKVRMGLKEGLAGLVAEKLQPLSVEDAAKHPRFKYFSEAGEDDYASFLGVPLIDRGVLQGVLVVQTVAWRLFSPEESRRLLEVASQLGPIVSEARNLEQFIAPSQERLWQLARNIWWSWNSSVERIFRELNARSWRELDHNPVSLLAETSLADLEKRASELVLHSRINHEYNRLLEYRASKNTWSATHAGVLQASPVAYFSAEFGLHESIPIYSGGLGVLAGDHVKSASDLGVPLVGIGLFYDQGYFRQRLDSFGVQSEEYMDVNPSQLPLEPALDINGKPAFVEIATRTGSIKAKVWRLIVGRCSLLLLDSDVEGNDPEDRELTSRLYGGDERVRIRQELLLGVGGVRALQATDINPGVLHLNEGHSAFAVLEMIRLYMNDDGASFDDAVRRVASQTVFTTHTPVPAGHDRFSPELIEEHIGPLRDQLGISHEHLMSLGRVDVDHVHEPFCMTVLALKLSRRANAVSSLHGRVSRRMWRGLWPEISENEVPIGHITNGVHVLSWLSPQMHQLYDRHFGVNWPDRCSYHNAWEGIEKVDDGELWETHTSLKSRLIEFVRRRITRDASRRDEPAELIENARRALSHDTLTIGFARRFATYKRANMFLSEFERLVEIVSDAQRPVQFVFAGKAHPRDEPGKAVLQQIAEYTQHPDLMGKLVFIEDYDINVGRHLVQGVDVWLNNPRRPLEASGTSGQKVVLNGGLNMSILDGWWAEAYNGTNGFAIGNGRSHVNNSTQDARDADSFYDVLQEEVIPLYYERDHRGLPRNWIARMKNAIRTLGWRFSADRMVKDYVTHCYVPAAGGESSRMHL